MKPKSRAKPSESMTYPGLPESEPSADASSQPSYDYNDAPRYEPVHKRRARAEQAARTHQDQGAPLSGVRTTRQAIATSVWGRAWCRHLEQLSDYASRLPRGRSYLRHGSVIDLKISLGQITGQVQGQRLYEIDIKIKVIESELWDQLKRRCQGSIASVIDLMQGKISDQVMQSLIDPEAGIFPQYHEIRMFCTCPDDADMCKHVAAVLYGVAVRFDSNPAELFELRGIDTRDLLASTLETAFDSGSHDNDTFSDTDLSRLFNLELDDDLGEDQNS